VTRKRIRRDQARLGMFVHGFSGSWFSHPFWRRRFLLTNPADLAKLLDSDVEGVIINTAKGLDVVGAKPAPAGQSAAARPAIVEAALAAPPAQNREASASKSWGSAKETVNCAKRAMRAVFEDARLGRAIDAQAVGAVVDDISKSMVRHRDALLKIVRLKSKDEYTYMHSVAVCALMVNLARELGLDAQTTADMGTAGLLHDIGKMAVPSDILNKPAKLTDQEFALIQTHPEKGFRLLEASGIPAVALDVARHHHEKIDGTGYPHRLQGEQISLAARMGAICDVYDALTSDRSYKNAWKPVEAITRMQSWAGQFDPDLLFRFMRSVGVFPIGMVVQLRSSRLGVVVDNGRRASRPSVQAFFSTSAKMFIPPELVVTGDEGGRDSIVAPGDPEAWGITPDQMARFQPLARGMRLAS
jgi:putative nucleotidyltransferase with HDIG domain